MVTTISGFDGSIDESTFSRMQALTTTRGVVANRSSFSATAVTNARAVRLTGGVALDAGVLVEVSDATAATVTIIGPSAGQWSLIVMRRDWDTNSVTYASLPHDLTSTTQPLTPPTGLPSTFQDRPGVVTDQPLWWAWSVNGSTAVVLVDAREVSAALKKSGTIAQRSTYYGPTPSARAGLRALQGSTWFNTDTNLHEVFMALYDATTNPGGVQAPATAGWYAVGQNGVPKIAAWRNDNKQTLPAGGDVLVIRENLVLPTPRFVRIEHWARWNAPGNAAGAVRAEVYIGNATRYEPAFTRVHSEGGPARYSPVLLSYDIWLPAGTHRIDTLFDMESASTTSYKHDATITVTGASRS